MRAGTSQFVLTVLAIENIELLFIINCLTKSMIMINSHSQQWHALDVLGDAPGPRVYLWIKTFIGFFISVAIYSWKPWRSFIILFLQKTPRSYTKIRMNTFIKMYIGVFYTDWFFLYLSRSVCFLCWHVWAQKYFEPKCLSWYVHLYHLISFSKNKNTNL